MGDSMFAHGKSINLDLKHIGLIKDEADEMGDVDMGAGSEVGKDKDKDSGSIDEGGGSGQGGPSASWRADLAEQECAAVAQDRGFLGARPHDCEGRA